MRVLRVAAALALFPALAWGQSSRPSIGLQGQGAQSGAAVTIAKSSGLSNLNANVTPVTMRGPTPNDVLGYTPNYVNGVYQGGGSLWRDPQNNIYQLDNIQNGQALWLQIPGVGPYPCDGGAGWVACNGTRRLAANWTGPGVDVSILVGTTITTKTFYFTPDDGLPVAAIKSFIAPTVNASFAPYGIAYLTWRYDQSDGGNNIVSANATYSAQTSGVANGLGCSGGAGGSSLTEAMLRDCPMLSLQDAIGSDIPVSYNATERAYHLGVSTYLVTGTSGQNTITLTGYQNGAAWFFYPGNTVSGNGVPSNTCIGAGGVNMTTGVLTLVTCGTSTASNLTQTLSNPATLSFAKGTVSYVGDTWPSTGPVVPWQTNTVVGTWMGGENGQTSHLFALIGAPISTAYISYPETSTPWDYFGLPGATESGTSGRAQNSSTNNVLSVGSQWPSASPQVLAFSHTSYSGTAGRGILWQINNNEGLIQIGSGITAVNLTSGSVGFTNQFINCGSNCTTDDMTNWDVMVRNVSSTNADFAAVTASLAIAHKLWPQIVNREILEGSSTTACNGANSSLCKAYYTYLGLLNISPAVVFNQAQGGGVWVENYFVATGVAPLVATGLTNNAQIKWGVGNDLQSATPGGTGACPITSQTVNGDGSVTFTSSANLNTTCAIYPGLTLISAPAAGSGGLPTGTLVQSVNQGTGSLLNPQSFTVAAAYAPSATVTGVAVVNDSANRLWAGVQALDASYCALGLHYDGDGSSTRGNFGTPAAPTATTSPYAASGSNLLQEFWTFNAIIQQNWQTLSCMRSYTDENLQPEEGGDAGASTVASIVDSTHACILTAGLTPAAAYLVALNYSFWQGMQVNIAADLGAEQVISVGAQGAGCANSSAYLVTFGYSTNGMTVGEIIHFENPTPWTTFPDPQCMQQDHQHFWQRCYKMMVAKWMAQAVGNSLP